MIREGWEQSQRRFEALWHNERLDRNTVAIQLIDDPQKPFLDELLPLSEEHRRFMDETFIYEMLREQMARVRFYGDAFPCMTLYLGTCAHGAYTKKVDYSVSSGSVWLHPVMDDITDTLQFDENAEFLQATTRIIKHLTAHNSREYLIGNTDNCSSLDTLSSLRGVDNLLVDMLTEPEAVESQIAVLQNILCRTENGFAEPLLATNGGGTVTEFMHLWSDGYHHQLQCDMAAMISPALFERFAVPELSDAARWMKRVVYHLDGQEQIRFLDMILSIDNIQLIQWTPVAGQPPTSAFIPELKRIQAAGKGLVLFPHVSEMPTLLAELAPKGIHFVPQGVETEEQALAVLQMLERA